jgi:molybdopterin-guanine dinucleotide biosynthesis protein A
MSVQMAYQSAVVLAGGNSSRMQQNKALLQVGVHSFVSLLTQQLAHQTARVYISASEQNAVEYEQLPYTIITDEIPNQGPMQAMISVLRHVKTPWVFIVSVDAPSVDQSTVVELWNQKGTADAVILSQGGRDLPLIGWYATHTLPIWERLFNEGHRKLKMVLNQINYHTVAGANHVGYNINTPHEYKQFVDGN